MAKIIEPRVLKGFRDILPDKEMLRRNIVRSIEDSCRQFGFVPIDTPVLEYTEVLLGKGGGETDKQVYRFEDNGGRDVSMRFDLTVPFARFMGAHVNELYLPFKRYHFAKVWRGENTQRGRYREFMQCDFDIVGVDSAASDLEILQLMYANFASLGISGVTFRLSHRGLFNRFLENIGAGSKGEEVLRAVDKLPKIGEENTREVLNAQVGTDESRRILEYIVSRETNEATLANMESLAGGPCEESRRLRDLLALAEELGMSERFAIDPSITRGLDYYTGIVYETFLNELPDIGSVCSGGRYNDLASLYTKTELPGVGSSIGLDRLMAALEELAERRTADSTAADGAAAPGREIRGADVLILMLDERFLGRYAAIASEFRAAGFRAEVFPVAKKLGQQFTYAEKKGIPVGIIAGESEITAGTLNYKNLVSRTGSEGVTLEEAIKLAAEDLRES
jgi:histidyl-tRNA synthetase